MKRVNDVLCHNYNCSHHSTKACGACGESWYCGAGCQKKDWKSHKMWCANKLPTEYQTANELAHIKVASISRSGNLLAEGKPGAVLPMLEKLLIFEERQYGTKIHGEHYRLRHDGSKIDDMPLINTRVLLGSLLYQTEDLDKALTCAIECRRMLEIRRTQPGVGVFLQLNQTESLLSDIYIVRSESSKARHHAEQSVVFARQFTGANHITLLYHSLNKLAVILKFLNLRDDAQKFCEEAYNLVSELHGPEHPDVQHAALELIEIYMCNDQLSKAEDFAHINYETLMSRADPDKVLVASTMLQLVNIWIRKPEDPIDGKAKGDEAERLVRKAYEMALGLFGGDSHSITPFADAVCDVSWRRNKITPETRLLMERSLRNNFKVQGALNYDTAQCVLRIGETNRLLCPSNCDIYMKIQIGVMLVELSKMMDDLISWSDSTNDRDAVIRANKLMKELISEFLNNRDMQKMLVQSLAVTAEYMKAKAYYTALVHPASLHTHTSPRWTVSSRR